MKKTNKNLWVISIDPFSDFDYTPLLKFSQDAAKQAGAKLRVVYVLAPASLNWTGDFSGPWFKKYKPLAEAKLRELLAGDLREITYDVIACKDSGQRKAVQALGSYLEKAKANYVFISSHARQGLERLAMGSFAENLILTAKTPVMVTNRETRWPSQVRKIFVPTDLNEKGQRFIDSIAQAANHFGAEVVLYYKQPDPLDPIIQQGIYSLGGGWVSIQSFVEAELRQKQKEVDRVEAGLRKKGIQVTHVLESSPGDLIEGVNAAAKSAGADIIYVHTKAGSLAARLLGSVARGLVRHAELPVLVHR